MFWGNLNIPWVNQNNFIFLKFKFCNIFSSLFKSHSLLNIVVLCDSILGAFLSVMTQLVELVLLLVVSQFVPADHVRLLIKKFLVQNFGLWLPLVVLALNLDGVLCDLSFAE